MNNGLIKLRDIIDRNAGVPNDLWQILIRKVFFERPGSSDLDIDKIEIVKNIIDTQRVDYIFVSEKAYFNPDNLAKRLNTYGFRSLYINLTKGYVPNPSDIFIATIDLSVLEFINLIQSTSVIIFSQGWLFRYSTCALIEIYKRNNRHYLDVMDLGLLMFPNIDANKEIKLKSVWGDDALANHQMQIWCEDFLLNNADRCYFPGSLGYLDDLVLDKRLIKKRFFINHPIDVRNFCTAAASEDICFAGGIPPFQSRRIKEFFGDAQLVTTIEKLYSQSCSMYLDVFNNPILSADFDHNIFYKPHLSLMNRYPKYRFLAGSTGRRFREILSVYKFGMMFYDFEGCLVGRGHYRNHIPSKFYTYIEAGLPIILSEEFVSAAKIVEAMGIGIIVAQSDIPFIQTIIKNIDQRYFRKNVQIAREFIYSEGLKQLVD